MADAIPERLFDRELSWIEFNSRVLAEAMDDANPLLERLKFIGIVSSNFDEFFMVRVAGLAQESAGSAAEVYRRAFDLMRLQHAHFTEVLLPEMAKSGIRRVTSRNISERQRTYLTGLFHKEFMPLLTPIALREDSPSPNLVNLSVYRVIQLLDLAKPFEKLHAVIEVPRKCPRLVTLPVAEDGTGHDFILFEDVISLFVRELFRGYEVADEGLLRLTRASELTLDEEKDADFSRVMSEAIRSRRLNQVVRAEISGSAELTTFLKRRFAIPAAGVFAGEAWVDLRGASQLAFQPGMDHLKVAAWEPRTAADFEDTEDIWTQIKTKDTLVFQPYESFDSFLRLLNEAARDPDVLAIKQTLYRTGSRAAVISALEKAAENGKQVTALVELKARFDEEANIEGARRLEAAGATVLYGVVGLKTHAKICLIVRREPDGIRRYVHLSTGNYNEKTARIYSDFSLFTADEDISKDAASLFNLITGFSQPTGFAKLEIAPFSLRKRLERLIMRESMRAHAGGQGLIIAKMNSLVDPKIIEALYKASQAGVKVQLNIRGVCCLKPGVKGMSENIEVVSIVDMFLEHARMFYFYNGGEDEIFLSSADWMPRNLDRRIEIMFPITQSSLRKEALETLKLFFRDNVKSWALQSDGSYRRRLAGDEKRFRVQEYLCRKYSDKSAAKRPPALDLKPQKPKKD
jgi:polyphosphate kinase